MDIAIVTGAETPLGLRLIERLIQQGCRVHGIGNNFSKVTYGDRNFVAHAVDLTDLAALRAVGEKILEQENRIDILIHSIDVTPGGAFEKLPVGNLEAVLKIGLLGPVMLTRLMLPNLLRYRGRLINVIPANKSGTPASAVNALLEGGLREMNRALFDAARNAGLRVTNLILRQNQAPAPADASDRQLAQSRIDPANVARVVEQLLDANATNVPDEITLHPPLSPEASEALPATPLPLDPYSAVVLPPKEYTPPEPEPIPTEKPQRVERLIPYTDDEMEDKIAAAIEDFEAHPERYLEKTQPIQGKTSTQDDSPQGNPNQGGGGNSGKSKRRRRRGGRNRNKSRGDSNDPNQNQAQRKDGSQPASDSKGGQDGTKHNGQSSAQEPEKGDQPPKQEGKDRPKRSRRRGGSGRKTPQGDQSKAPKATSDANSPREQPKGESPSKPTDSSAQPDRPKTDKSGAAAEPKKPVKKAAKKKAAKKGAKKAAQKKTAAKKAAKKRAAKKSTPPNDS